MQKSDILGTLPIGKLVLRIASPVVLSMVVQALYNIVDSIFIARISETALSAVSMSFPIQGIIGAFGLGIGTGVSSVLAKSLGEKKPQNVSRSAGTSVFMILVVWLVFLLFGLFCVPSFFRIQTTDQGIISQGTIYLSICSSLCIGQLAQMVFERHLQATGRSGLSMIAQMSGAISNIILDPFLIFGLCGLPRMEILGAATATVIGQMISAVVAIVFCLTKNREVVLKWRYIRCYGELAKEIIKIGAATFFMMSLSAVMNFGVNKISISFSVSAAAAFGAYFRMQSLVFVPIQGLGSAVIPIISYNYGAQKMERITETVRLNLIFNVVYMLVFAAIFASIPGQLMLLFNATPGMYEVGCVMLRIIVTGFVFMGISLCLSTPLQVLGYWKLSIGVSVFRQAVPFLPLMYVLSLMGNIDLIWLTFPIIELLGSVISCIGFAGLYKKVINRKPLAEK